MLDVKIKKGTAFLLTDRVNRRYFSKIDIAEGYLVYGEKKAYFSDARYFEDTTSRLKNSTIQSLLFTGLEAIKDYLVKNDIHTIFIDFDRVTLSEFNEFKAFNVEILDGRNEINKARSVKTEEEILNIKKASKIAQKAYHKAIKQVKLGMSELELKDLIEGYIKEQGSTPAFETIVAFGKGSSVPHHETGKTKLKNNQPILVDMGATYNGYLSDLTRMAFFGKPTKKFMRTYNAVLTANLKAIEEIRTGLSTKEADAIARNYLKGKNLDKYFTHSLGHGVGLEIHENIVLSPTRKEQILENGMAFTIEPGVYFENEFGIRIEDTVVLRDGKVERLFTDKKNLIIIKDKI